MGVLVEYLNVKISILWRVEILINCFEFIAWIQK